MQRPLVAGRNLAEHGRICGSCLAVVAAALPCRLSTSSATESGFQRSSSRPADRSWEEQCSRRKLFGGRERREWGPGTRARFSGGGAIYIVRNLGRFWSVWALVFQTFGPSRETAATSKTNRAVSRFFSDCVAGRLPARDSAAIAQFSPAILKLVPNMYTGGSSFKRIIAKYSVVPQKQFHAPVH